MLEGPNSGNLKDQSKVAETLSAKLIEFAERIGKPGVSWKEIEIMWRNLDDDGKAHVAYTADEVKLIEKMAAQENDQEEMKEAA